MLHPGWFDVTASKFANENPGSRISSRRLRSLFLNCRGVRSSLGDRIVPGTVIMFDEYFNYPNWKGHEHKAFTEFQGNSGKRFKYIGYSIQQVAAVAL